MRQKPLHVILYSLLFILLLASCARSPVVVQINSTATNQLGEQKTGEKSTFQATEAASVTAPVKTGAPGTIEDNPCNGPYNKYMFTEKLGEINPDYLGSWHASASVGSGYAERFVFFPSGNYLFFPSQYGCDSTSQPCIPSSIEDGNWGIQGNQLNLAKEGDTNNIKTVPVGKVVDSPADESPYPLKTTIDGTTYWLMSRDTNLWDPATGEECK